MFGKIWRGEEVFQQAYRGAKYRSQLREAGAGDSGVIDRMVLMELFTGCKTYQMFLCWSMKSILGIGCCTI